MSEIDLEKVIELRDLLNEMLPDDASVGHLAKVIGTVLSIYQIDDARDVAFICFVAASQYCDFLAHTQDEDLEVH